MIYKTKASLFDCGMVTIVKDYGDGSSVIDSYSFSWFSFNQRLQSIGLNVIDSYSFSWFSFSCSLQSIGQSYLVCYSSL